ncbi:MAG TPA: UDP-N-acetylglucosamine 1-carboxyvinyltransferase [Planctomycetaceae bacterium]|nr:UDP-N-acetylglucosamine 1-carboxyvinyltransferase [Planctomycetaceae bacterium]
MEQLIVQGGRTLSGRVAISGSKNASLPILAASILAEEPVVLRNVPNLIDVEIITQLLMSLGISVLEREDGSLRLETVDPAQCIAGYELVSRMRASICVLGPLIGKRGYARVALPGGCRIGDRPVDLHLHGLRALGAEIRVEGGDIIAEADRLVGTKINLAGPCGSTVTGTCNVMSAATLARGVTLIESAACEPEVADLGRFLIGMGARIEGLGTNQLVIEGVEELLGTDHTVIPDRIEAATLAIAAAITRSRIELEQFPFGDLCEVLSGLRSIGVEIEQNGAIARIEGRNPLRAADLVARPYPGIPTDTQAQFTALLTLVPGLNTVTDAVFPNRFMHVPELRRLGANIRCAGGTATIRGTRRLTGTDVVVSDLRAGAALVLAGLAAEGTSIIHRIDHLDRGYERLDEKLNRLGAEIQRVEDRQSFASDTIPWTTASETAAAA